MIPPIGLFLEVGKLFKHSYCRSSFQGSNQLRDGDLWGNVDDHMDMIGLDVQRYDFTSKLIGKDIDTIMHFLMQWPGKHAISIFRCPHQMILAVP